MFMNKDTAKCRETALVGETTYSVQNTEKIKRPSPLFGQNTLYERFPSIRSSGFYPIDHYFRQNSNAPLRVSDATSPNR